MIDATATRLLAEDVEANPGGIEGVMANLIGSTLVQMLTVVKQGKAMVSSGLPEAMVAQGVEEQLFDLSASLVIAGAVIQENYPGVVGGLIAEGAAAALAQADAEAQAGREDAERIAVEDAS